jgi:hypothetical protein
MRLIISGCAAALVVAACGRSNEAQPVQNITVRSAQQEELHRLDDLNRAIALKRALYDSGYTCRRVTSSGFVATYKNLDMWTASCADGRNWAIFSGPDGSAQVRDCADVERFGLPRCEIRQQESATTNAAG